MSETLLYFLVAATMQNAVLTVGLGVSPMLKMIRRPRQLLLFGGILMGFTVATAAVFYPIDQLLPVGDWIARMLRPFIVIAIVTAWYLLTVPLLSRLCGEWYRHNRHLFPLAAFNTLVVGMVLLVNYQVQLEFFPALGLAAGAVVGFVIITALTVEGVSRVDNPDTPAAFRGLPVTLVYLGLLALALMGFEPVVNLI